MFAGAMQVRGLYLAILFCLVTALSVKFGEAQDAPREKMPPVANDQVLAGDNTQVLNTVQNKTDSVEVNSPGGIGISTAKPSVVANSNDSIALANETESVEQSKPTNDSEQGKKTKTLDSISVKVIRSEENGIWFSDMVLGKDIPFKNTSHLKAFSTDYHYEKRLVFFAANDSIIRDEVFGSKMISGNSSLVAFRGVDGPKSLALDWVHDKLYWYSNKHSSVECSELDGSNRTVLIDSLVHTEYPSNIAIDPYQGYLFFVSNYSIYRASLTGADLLHIQPKGNESRAVRAIAVDIHNKRLYYTGKDGHYKKGQPYLASCDYGGQEVQELLVKKGWNDIFSIGVFQETVYFAHFSKNGSDTLWSIDLKESPLHPVLMLGTEGGLWSIKVYHPKVQKKGEEVDLK